MPSGENSLIARISAKKGGALSQEGGMKMFADLLGIDKGTIEAVTALVKELKNNDGLKIVQSIIVEAQPVIVDLRRTIESADKLLVDHKDELEMIGEMYALKLQSVPSDGS